MKNMFSFIFFMVIVIFSAHDVLSSDLRVQSLGNTSLVLMDRDNNLNLYDLLKNPAYMLYDDQQNWLKFYGGGNYDRTSLKRLYDPDIQQNISVNFEGYKLLSQNQAIWGKVNYGFMKRYHVLNSLENDPYSDDPLFLADSTSGNFYSDGPSIEVAYNIQPTRRFGIGAGLVYDISTSLKKQYTRPRTIHRNFEGQFAATYLLSKNLTFGTSLTGSFLQDQIELSKSWDGKEIYTMRYRSEQVYREVLGNFDRYIKLNGWHWNSSIQYYALNSIFRNIFAFDYKHFSQETSDNSGVTRRMESYWYQNIYQISSYSRIILDPLVFGAKIALNFSDDWSRHPDQPILITEQSRDWLEIGGGISYRFPSFLIIGEGSYYQSDVDYKDYQSLLRRKGTHDLFVIKSGFEYYLDQIHQIRFGYDYGYFESDYYSPRYLPDNKTQYFSFGLAETRSRYEIELHFDYIYREAVNTPDNFNGWNTRIYTRIYMF